VTSRGLTRWVLFAVSRCRSTVRPLLDELANSVLSAQPHTVSMSLGSVCARLGVFLQCMIYCRSHLVHSATSVFVYRVGIVFFST
jgi:hypothetical protein